MKYEELNQQIEMEISKLGKPTIRKSHQYAMTKHYIYSTLAMSEMNLVQSIDFTFGGIITSSLKQDMAEMLAYYDAYKEFAAQLGARSIYSEEDYNDYVEQNVDKWAEQAKEKEEYEKLIHNSYQYSEE